MNPVTTALTLNLQLPNIATVAWSVQGDLLSRYIEATLVDGSIAWNPQAGYDGVIRAKKPDGTVCVYDVDDDGNPAVTWVGNVATISIAHQAMTAPGSVFMQLEFYDSNNSRVSAFGWVMNVQPSAVTDTQFLSTDYYNILSLQIAAVLEAAGGMTPSDATPLMDGVGYAGLSPYYSRGDHVHPSEILYFTAQPVSAQSTSGQIMRIPATGTNSAITTNTIVIGFQFANPDYITSNVSWQSYNGYIIFTGTSSAATTANVTLGTKGN